MPGPRARLLVSGDLHLGRYPSRVPPGDPALTVDAVVRSLVDQAIERRVDAVVLTGDVADESNKYFEAYGVLERMLRRLQAEGIPVVAVAGNHDYDVLGSVADAVGDGITVLGRGQAWESTMIQVDGRDAVELVGWSFAGPHVHESPLASWPGGADDVPTVGVVHTDLDVAGSPYAPVTTSDLQGTDAVAWLLGHIHAPSATEGEPLILYPGSPQPLDPGEPGRHGAWMVNVAADGSATAEMLPLATVRYDVLPVDVGGAQSATELRERITVALREHGDAIQSQAPGLRRGVVRLELTGRTAAYRSVGAVADELADGEISVGTLALAVDRVDDRARPALDLDRLAAGSGPVATLAGLALRLERKTLTDADLALVRQGVEALQQAQRARVFQPLAQNGRFETDLQTEAVRRLVRQTYRLLDQALEQRPSDTADRAAGSSDVSASSVTVPAGSPGQSASDVAHPGDQEPTGDALADVPSDSVPTGSDAASPTSPAGS